MSENPEPKPRRPRRVAVRDAQESLFIRKLKSLPGGMFEAIVQKLTEGATAAHVARWIVSQKPVGPCGHLAEVTLNIYVGAVRRRVRAGMGEVKHKEVEPFAYRAVMAEANLLANGDIKLIDEELKKQMKGLGEIFSMVQKHVISMSAQTMLKYCFMIQQARVKKMRELEESMGMLFPDGYKNIEVLREIASDIAKLEVGDLWMRGKSPLYKGSLTVDTGSEMKREQGPIAKRVAELGEVDRNLIRIASQKVIDMIQEEVNGGITLEHMEADTTGSAAGTPETSRP